MLISTICKFAIFNIPKTGTKSIRKALCLDYQEQNGKKIIDIIGGQKTGLHHHETLKGAIAFFPKIILIIMITKNS